MTRWLRGGATTVYHDCRIMKPCYQGKSIATDLEVSLGGDPNAVHYDARMLEGHNMKFKPKTKDATKAWKEIMSVKTTLIEAIIRHGYNVFVLDADTVLLQNPMDYVQSRTSQCDFQWQADGKSKFLWKDLQSRTHFNAGVYYALSNERTKLMYRKWLEAYSCQKGRREQHALTLVLHNTHR
ncbi:hypothetical protein SARC_00168 [Sphaeroforma arctica JP610]|uniref:Nucleotide-diphospho-sugar transferase domain-containing protein n=1 Tax=Sphaeroforma arctica JP610 TaxID=667725 RepID=A0A0L0GFV7_9EUKA|nr:hypothetical protein SARC_00168 [Sphaeroforma arctica JP610]KNC87734.1 hypothetical protein SARC_00168 [Sphaeroforma arctica JP610]|eukprot:XP_014161636.1 hypothetical protein SARC_00168 [Sphaeroforma arctica JP610]